MDQIEQTQEFKRRVQMAIAKCEVLVFVNGELKESSMTIADASLAERRVYDKSEVVEVFAVSPEMIGETEGKSYPNQEE